MTLEGPRIDERLHLGRQLVALDLLLLRESSSMAGERPFIVDHDEPAALRRDIDAIQPSVQPRTAEIDAVLGNDGQLMGGHLIASGQLRQQLQRVPQLLA